MLLEKVKATIARYGMLEKGGTVLIAVSGGVDSVVLLELLGRLASQLSLKLEIAHLDHGLRGEEAKEDARFVVSLGEAKGIPVVAKKINVRKMSEERRLGLEEAGRLARRDFLEETAKHIGASWIATGHTRDDRVETLLFNLIRGAGPVGLAGIRPVNPPYIRPLIDTSREEILTFARSQRLAWREDTTNQDLTFTRNRIRHQVIPLLEQINPRLREVLHRTADLLLEERATLEGLLEAPWEEVLASWNKPISGRASKEKGRVVLRRDLLANLPDGLQGLLLRRGIARARGGAGGDLQGIEKVHIDALRRLVISARAHGEFNLPGLVARIQGDELILSTHVETAAFPYESSIELGRTELPALGITLELSIKEWNGSQESLVERGSSVEVADADRVHFPLHVRSRQPGDRFRPLGMSREKRLKDFLIDERIPFYERDALPLLCDRERIIWIVGGRLSDTVRLTQKTRRALVMHVKELT